MRILIFGLAVMVGMCTAATGRELRSTELVIEPAEGVKALSIEDMAFSDCTYRGDADTDTFRISIVRIVHTVHQEKFDRVAADMEVSIERRGSTLACVFKNPKRRWWSLIPFSGFRKWEYEVTIIGPSRTEFSINTAFSSVDVSGLDGKLNADAAFSTLSVRDHRGRTDADIAFGRFETDRFAGSFDITVAFSSATVEMADLTGDSMVNTAFGSVQILLPRDTDADFQSSCAFGSVGFDMDPDPGGSGSHRWIGDTGKHIHMDVAFGSVNIGNRE